MAVQIDQSLPQRAPAKGGNSLDRAWSATSPGKENRKLATRPSELEQSCLVFLIKWKMEPEVEFQGSPPSRNSMFKGVGMNSPSPNPPCERAAGEFVLRRDQKHVAHPAPRQPAQCCHTTVDRRNPFAPLGSHEKPFLVFTAGPCQGSRSNHSSIGM